MLSYIPASKFEVVKDGYFLITDNLSYKSDFELDLLKKYPQSDDANVIIIKDDSVSKEGYCLKVSEDKIEIKASTKTGAYYAIQTIRQLAKFDLGGTQIPCCEINDEPKCVWRGIQLDESRHFFGMDEVKKLLDMMFMLKLNVFHWHLTDDTGWRIEIKKYPKLIEVGSKRKYSQIGGWKSLKRDFTPYEGYYTQDQIKEIIEYARERGIMVVPEIDFPAHCESAMASYNFLACREIATEVPGYFGGNIPVKLDRNINWNRTVCCGKETTFEFIFNVLDEVCELFDAPYIHMGGDEAPHGEWKKCPNCQRVIKENGLKNETELQGWFENRICEYLKEKGKMLIGWNEILKADNLNKDDKNIVIQYWTPQRDKNAEKYVNSGGKAILSNHQAFYFDMTYAQVPLQNTYNYKPEQFNMDSNSDGILGFEGELWTEWICNNEKLEHNAFPRLLALSEIAWSQDEKLDFNSFLARLDEFKPILDKFGITYADDKVSMPKSSLKKSKIMRKFYRGNPDLELELSAKYRQKGAK